MRSSTKPATPEQLKLLSRPEALDTLMLLKTTGWLDALEKDVENYFIESPAHPAAAHLKGTSVRNSEFLTLQIAVAMQVAVLLGFATLAFHAPNHDATSFHVVLAVWGALALFSSYIIGTFVIKRFTQT